MTQTATHDTTSFVPNRRPHRLAILIVLILAGLVVRLYNIDYPPVEFHPMRQYRAAIIAHYYYLESSHASPDELSLADTSAKAQISLEPTIVERMASILYLFVGRELLWLPRSLSVVFWVIGGLFLFSTAERLLSFDSGLIAVAYFLFNPFGIMASRAIQPDPLMIMLLLACTRASLWYYEKPSWARLVAVGILSSLPLFIKPISAPWVVIGFAALGFSERRQWRDAINLRSVIFALLVAIPTAIFYGTAILTPGSDLQGESHAQLDAALLLTREYWVGWFTKIGLVIGPLALLAALIGLVSLEKRRAQIYLLSLWASYVIMGLIFTYTISTHDYYSLQLIPIVGLSLAGVVTPMLDRVGGVLKRPETRTVVASLCLVLLAVFGAYENWWRNFAGVFYENADPSIRQTAPEVASIIGRSSHVVSLSQAYSTPFSYYAEMPATDWPTRIELAFAIYLGWADSLDAEFQVRVLDSGADYFVVTDLREFGAQPELQSKLIGTYEVVAETNRYIIFDLNKRLSGK